MPTIAVEINERGEVMLLRKEGTLVVDVLLTLPPYAAAQVSGALLIGALNAGARASDSESLAKSLEAFERTRAPAIVSEACQLIGRYDTGEQLTPKLTIIRDE